MQKPLVSIFLPTLLIGGAEKALVELANNLAEKGWRIHVVVMSNVGPLAENLSAAVELVNLKCNSFRQAILALARYYKSDKPSIVLSSLYATGLAAIAARYIASYKPQIIVGAHNSLKAKVARPDNAKDKFLLMPLCRIFFPLANGFIAVSKGLAHELEEIFRIPSNKIHAIYNPVFNESLSRLAVEPVTHPWLDSTVSQQNKTLISVGRLVEQKGYDVLLQALQLTRKSLDCRLIIVGGGPQLSDLENKARELGISDAVDFIGWQTNPYKFVARADLFVLSSRWEGLGNVLIEALACGCPVVSTNCRYGPEEILDCGKYGMLTNVDDPVDLSEKIISSLMSPSLQGENKAALIRRAHDFTVEASARQYAAYFSEVLTDSPTLEQVQS